MSIRSPSITELHRDEREPDCARVAVVTPCYRVAPYIAEVLNAIGPEVWRIYCVDDGSPDESRKIVELAAERDPRIRCLIHPQNCGVGAAVLTGYRQALADGADVIVKLDGDGQMPPDRIADLVAPLLCGEADYVKGNRFFHLDGLRTMPRVRLLGNIGLSFLAKVSTGYWSLFDPTNGFTAIAAVIARQLPFDKLHPGYFFESDMLFRLGVLRAVVTEIPIDARYDGQCSSLNVWKALLRFPGYHFRNLLKRLFYNYFLRDFSLASLHLLCGLALLTFGVVFGARHWIGGAERNVLASAGTVMLAGLPVILGTQFLLSFASYDVQSAPREPLQRKLYRRALRS